EIICGGSRVGGGRWNDRIYFCPRRPVCLYPRSRLHVRSPTECYAIKKSMGLTTQRRQHEEPALWRLRCVLWRVETRWRTIYEGRRNTMGLVAGENVRRSNESLGQDLLALWSKRLQTQKHRWSR